VDLVSKAALRTFASVVNCRVVLIHVLGYPYISKLHVMIGYDGFSIERGLSSPHLPIEPGASTTTCRTKPPTMATSSSEPRSRPLKRADGTATPAALLTAGRMV